MSWRRRFFKSSPAKTRSLEKRYRRLKGELLEERVALAAHYVVTGAGAGGGPHVRAMDMPLLNPAMSFFSYAPNFTGGVRVASGDVNGDGQEDIITGAGPGGGPHIRVFDGASQQLITHFFAFETTFTGGVHVAAGDTNGDGRAEIFVGADGPGSGNRVRIFDGLTGILLQDIVAPPGSFDRGVRVAAGDINGDGRADLIMGSGPGALPRVAVRDLSSGQIISDFVAYDPRFTGGIFVAAGNVRGDGRAEIITGPDVGGGPHVRVFDGLTHQELDGFFAYDPRFTGGVRVATADADGDGQADILTGAGPGGGPHVRAFRGLDRAALQSFFAYDPNFRGGVYVGARLHLDALPLPPGNPPNPPGTGPDLVGAGLNIAEDAEQWGRTLSVQFAVRNQGNAATPGFLIRWFLSQDPFASPDDVLLLQSGLAGTNGVGQSFTHIPLNGNSVGGAYLVDLRLPDAPPPGFVGTNFYVVMSIDYPNQVAETNEANNNGEAGDKLDRDFVTITVGPPPPPPPSPFRIEVINMTGLSPTQQAAFRGAADRWSQIITSELSDEVIDGTLLNQQAALFGLSPFYFFGLHGLPVDDLVIDARGTFIDGPGGILGQAAPILRRGGGTGLPYFGFMQFDSADLLDMENRSQYILETVILHEMGHVLGVGSQWRLMNLISGSLTPDPRFIGPNATAAYNQIFGVNEPGVPLESFFTAGAGSAESHWRESMFVGDPANTVLVNELMTPFVGPRQNSPIYSPISAITIGSLADIGYQVNLSRADVYFPLRGVQFSVANATATAPFTGNIHSSLAFLRVDAGSMSSNLVWPDKINSAIPGLLNDAEEEIVPPPQRPISSATSLQTKATELAFSDDAALFSDADLDELVTFNKMPANVEPHVAALLQELYGSVK